MWSCPAVGVRIHTPYTVPFPLSLSLSLPKLHSTLTQAFSYARGEPGLTQAGIKVRYYPRKKVTDLIRVEDRSSSAVEVQPIIACACVVRPGWTHPFRMREILPIAMFSKRLVPGFDVGNGSNETGGVT